MKKLTSPNLGYGDDYNDRGDNRQTMRRGAMPASKSPSRSRSPKNYDMKTAPERHVRISNKRVGYKSNGINLTGEPKIMNIKTL